jgi:hypothetical protein
MMKKGTFISCREEVPNGYDQMCHLGVETLDFPE